MKISNCLDSKQLINYIDGKLTEHDKQNLTHHLEKCERCARNLKILNQLDEILNMEDKKVEDGIYNLEKSSNCISDEILYRYLDATVTESEAAAIERHLNSCSDCFNDMFSIVKNTHSAITDFERSEINKLRTITPDEQVTRILEHSRQPIRSKKVKIIATLKERVKDFFERWIYTKYVWRPAIILSVLIIIAVGTNRGVKYYQTGYQVAGAEKLLWKNYKNYIATARLSGGYQSSGIGIVMASDVENLSYLAEVDVKLNRAIKNGTKSSKAKQFLAQVFIIQRQFDNADSIFNMIEKESATSTALLNDRGVLYFQQQNWEMAEKYFQSAIEKNENFLEAYYNLALTKNELGKLEEAILLFNKYLNLEHNEEWRIAAQSIVTEIRKKTDIENKIIRK